MRVNGDRDGIYNKITRLTLRCPWHSGVDPSSQKGMRKRRAPQSI